jgi:prepilin-type N-terminal cleavage/methylation domain-containing protein
VNRRAGMTLLEVLIAVSLVALLSVGMLYTVNAGLGSVASINRRVESLRKASGAQRILEQEFAAFMPVVAPCGWVVPGGRIAQAYFFQGQPNVLRFVSAYSLQEAGRGHPQILELFTVPTPDSAGLRLMVNEVPYFSPYSAGALCLPPMPDSRGGPEMLGFPPPQLTPRSFILADRLAQVSFAYQEPILEPPFVRWTQLWTQFNILPSAVRIDMIPLSASSARLPALPFYARILPNRSTNEGLN